MQVSYSYNSIKMDLLSSRYLLSSTLFEDKFVLKLCCFIYISVYKRAVHSSTISKNLSKLYLLMTSSIWPLLYHSVHTILNYLLQTSSFNQLWYAILRFENFKETYPKNREQYKFITNLNFIYDQYQDYHFFLRQQPLRYKYLTLLTLKCIQASLTLSYIQFSINNA